MSDLTRLLLGWLGAVSLAAFLLFAADKWKARHGRWRVPESVLWAAALCGGGVGAALGMRLLRHKTKKGFFHIGLPLLAALQLALLLWSVARDLRLW